jgi:CheY-like chemotaxis protein
VTALRILLVEDDENIRAVLAEVLESLGHSVCGTAATESEAVIAAAKCMPDLMIVDIGLASGSGVAAVAHILQTGHVPHLFKSGVRPEYLANGAPVLRKPFSEAELIRSIEAALKLSQPERGVAHE